MPSNNDTPLFVLREEEHPDVEAEFLRKMNFILNSMREEIVLLKQRIRDVENGD